MGAAGLTCSAVEMGAKGDLGVELNLERVPLRETGMTPYEIMLSESQERMLMVLAPEKQAEAEAIFAKYGLDFAVVGHTTDTLRFVVKMHGDTYADLPIKELGDEAPLYDRPWEPTRRKPVVAPGDVPAPLGTIEALKRLLACPDLASRRWIFEQYDTIIGGDTVQGPGGDAAVVRIAGGRKALAITTDVTPRYCEADPIMGGRQAVAEAYRNITAVGGLPLAITDNLNFGDPRKPAIMGQIVGAIKGLREACRALDMPVVSGNVSLYNETEGRAILPTPAIGAVGVLPDWERAATIAFKKEGEEILLVGVTRGWLGRSLYQREITGVEDGAPPDVDLFAERRHGEFVRALVRDGRVTACHDVSDGGLLVAVAEMAMGSGIGARLDAKPKGAPAHAVWFGEDQGRYVVTARAGDAAAILAHATAAGVPMARIGTTEGAALSLAGEEPVAVTELKALHEGWFPEYMG
jgi:phosphoribosylformylglycinamidine synthase